MDRRDIVQLCESEVLEIAASLFGTPKNQLKKFDDFEGCANLVYQYEVNSEPRILRISYRPDRSIECIQAELHFINHLAFEL